MKIRTKYTSFDMLRFLSFSKKEENKDIKGIDLIRKYNETYPELTAEQKLENIKAALGLDFPTTKKQVEMFEEVNEDLIKTCKLPKYCISPTEILRSIESK